MSTNYLDYIDKNYLDYIDKLVALGLTHPEAVAFNSKLSREIFNTEFLSTQNALSSATAKIKTLFGIKGNMSKPMYPLVAAGLRDLEATQITYKTGYLNWLNDKVKRGEVIGHSGNPISPDLLKYLDISIGRPLAPQIVRPAAPLIPIPASELVYDAELAISTVIAKKQRRNPTKNQAIVIKGMINGATFDTAMQLASPQFLAKQDSRALLQLCIQDITGIDFAQLSRWCSTQSVPIGRILVAAVYDQLEQIKTQPFDGAIGDVRHIAWPTTATQPTDIDRKYLQRAKLNQPAGFAHRAKNKMRPDAIDEQVYNELEECLYWLLVACAGKPIEQYSSEIAAMLVSGIKLDDIYTASLTAYPNCSLKDRTEFDRQVGRMQIDIFQRHKGLRVKQMVDACKAKNINYRAMFAVAAEMAYAKLPEKWAILPDRRNLEWPECMRAKPQHKEFFASLIAELAAPAARTATQSPPAIDISSSNSDPFKDWVQSELLKMQIAPNIIRMFMGIIDGSIIERYVDKKNPDLKNTSTAIATIQKVMETVFGTVPETMPKPEKFATHLRMKFIRLQSNTTDEPIAEEPRGPSREVLLGILRETTGRQGQ